MKIKIGYLLAGLLGSAALLSAQVSDFSIESLTYNSGSMQQHVGCSTRANALIKITSTGGLVHNNFTHVLDDYYSLPSYTGGTVYSTANGWLKTTMRNTTAPSWGYNSENLIFNLSGRFYLEAPTSYTDEDGNPQVQGGTTATITFTVGTAANFTLDLWGHNTLSQFGLDGASTPLASRGTQWWPEGSGQSLGYLTPGTYQILVELAPDSSSGIVVASINAQ